MVDLFPYGPDRMHASSKALLAIRHAHSFSFQLYRFTIFGRLLGRTLRETTSAPLLTRTIETTSFPAIFSLFNAMCYAVPSR